MTARARTNGSAPSELEELTLEQKVDTLIWLHAEVTLRLMQVATALAGLITQQMTPQVQQNILGQLVNVQPGTAALLGVPQAP